MRGGLLVLACLLGLGWPLEAQAERARVRLDGRTLFEVENEIPELARERALQIERRLSRVLETPTLIRPVQIAPRGAARELNLGGRELLTLTPDDARDRQTPIDSLALQWKADIDTALRLAGQRRLSPWGRFSAETQASVETAFARLFESGLMLIPRLLAGLLVLLAFWALASLLRWLLRLLFQRVISDLTVENLIRQIAYYSVWALGLLLATSALGIDPQALATGLGLTGIALGFALKDILSNFVAGTLILALRPFEIGDQIVVGETEGAVERINLRATRLRTYDGRAVLVPNGEVFSSRITNNTESPIRRGSIQVPLGYDSDLDQALVLVREAVQSAPGVLAQPPASVRVRDLLQDDILLEARFWTDSRRSDFVATGSEVRAAVVRAFKAGDLGLPDPDVRILVTRPKPDQT